MDSSEGIIRIIVRDEVEVAAGRITIGDVADVIGNPVSLRMGIARLDLDEFGEPGKELLISQRRIGYRLQLAGLDPTSVRLEGARLARVKLRGVQAVAASQIDGVLVASRPLQPGEILSTANIRVEYRPQELSGVSPASGYGRAVGMPGAANQVIRPEHFAQSQQSVVVKKGDFVRLMARAGPLEISTRGEALADGKIGQTIPVRNLDSKQVVHARIIRPATVLVEY